jgi:hypothetical protein
MSNSKPMTNYMDTKFKSRTSGVSMTLAPDQCYVDDNLILSAGCEEQFERSRAYEAL